MTIIRHCHSLVPVEQTQKNIYAMEDEMKLSMNPLDPAGGSRLHQTSL